MTSPLQTQSEKARRIVFVGGAGSIGAALVEAAVGRGDRVIVLDLPSSLAGRPQSGIERAIALDATDPAQVDAAFGQVGRVWDGLDGLVILPGLLRRKQPVVEFSLDDWNEVVAVSLTSTFLTVKAAIALLRRGASPGIVTMSSGLGVQPAPGYGPYSAAKAAVISLTRTLALELAPEIRVNAIAPGLIETAFQRGGAGQPGLHEDGPPDILAPAAAYHPPLGRLAVPQDLVGIVMFLLSDASSMITGQVMHVNAGALMA